MPPVDILRGNVGFEASRLAEGPGGNHIVFGLDAEPVAHERPGNTVDNLAFVNVDGLSLPVPSDIPDEIVEFLSFHPRELVRQRVERKELDFVIAHGTVLSARRIIARMLRSAR
jgi:hypothetical protein